MSETDQVFLCTFQNRSGFFGAFQFAFSIWNVFAYLRIRQSIRENRPDIIHIHNWHFGSGPIILRTAIRLRIPIVVTLHNYRLLCPSGTLSHDGMLFTASIGTKFPWKAIIRRVYRHSFFQTFWLAFIVWFHGRIGTWRIVTKYIVFSEFAKSLFLDSGLGISKDKFVVKPNFINLKRIEPNARINSALFVGRLSKEKGIELLLHVFSKTKYNIRIVGDGPLRGKVLMACEKNSNINYLGFLGRTEVMRTMCESQVLIFASTWYEGMPLTIIEAFASGLPVIACNFGVMATMVQHEYNGLLFDPGNDSDLLEKVDYWQQLTEDKKNVLRMNAFDTFKNKYSAERNLVQIRNIYESISFF